VGFGPRLQLLQLKARRQAGPCRLLGFLAVCTAGSPAVNPLHVLLVQAAQG